MARKEVFAGNWKMYKTRAEAVDLVKSLISGLSIMKNREYVVFPPAPYAGAVADLCAGTPFSVGMQNMHFEKEGAFTGEVSPLMVKDCGCRYILIGHSERRNVFGEKDEDVNRKVKTAFEFGLDPMICVGELLEEREKGLTNDVIKRQVEKALAGISREQMKKVVIAYEPVWAIGTGKVATPETAEDTHKAIRLMMGKLYDSETADLVPILYGGSVNANNIDGLYAKENIDGVLVGGASLKPDSFLKIINVH